METKAANLGKWEKQLRQWGKKLDRLAAKADKAGAAEEAQLRKNIDDLKAKYQTAQGRLEELRAAGHENWATFKVGVERAWNELSLAFKNLTK